MNITKFYVFSKICSELVVVFLGQIGADCFSQLLLHLALSPRAINYYTWTLSPSVTAIFLRAMGLTEYLRKPS